jgi:hypothetical protein
VADDRRSAGALPDRPPFGERIPHPPDIRTPAAKRGLAVAGPPVRVDEPPATPAPARATGRGRRRLLAIGALVLVLVAVGATVAVTRPDSDDERAAETERAETPPPTPVVPTQPPPEPTIPPEPAAPEEPPAEWNPEILDLVRFVERERELTFAHPVRVDLLSEDDFAEEVGGEQGIVGFYDGQRIRIRGTELTPGVRGTLVHELTHALDDQNLGIRGPEGVSPEEHVAYMALVEGDAVRMEWAYDQTLIDSGADPRDVLDEAHTGVGAPGTPAPSPPPAPRSGSGTTTTTVGSRQQAPGGPQPTGPEAAYGADIPSLTDALGQSPYFVGKQLIDVLVGTGGNAAVDAAFRDPPRTTEQVLDPRAYLARDERVPVRARTADMPKGTFENQTSLGALNLYLVLAAGIDPVTALDAATGWGGESAVAYTDAENRQCVDLAVVGDTEADTAEIGDAFAEWASGGLADHAAVARRSDGAQVLTACGMGAGSTNPFDALVLAEARGAQIWVAMRDGGRDAGAAFAFGDCVVHAAPLDALLTPVASGGLAPQSEAELADAAAGC